MKTPTLIPIRTVFFALCILHFAFCASPAWAIRPYTPVHPDPVLEPWRWRSFPELNGLGLRCMAEAKDRAMWFGVDKGAMRYDGVKWTAFTEKDGLYGAPVDALCVSRNGSVYAGTPKGINRFKDGKWYRVFPPEGDPSTGSGQALPWPVLKLMEAKDGSVWAGTQWGALRLGQEGPTLYTTEQMGAAPRALAPSVRLSIVPDEATPARPWGEGIGVAAIGAPAARIQAVIYALAPGGPGEAAGLKVGDRVTAVDGQPGATWNRLNGPAGTSVRLTVQREGRPFEVTVTRRQVEGTFRNFPIDDVYEDRDRALWFGVGRYPGGGEIVRYAPSTLLGTQHSEWRLYTEKDGLEIGGGPHIAQTRDGIIWTVSNWGLAGVNRFDGKRWTHFRLSDLGGGNINSSILETRDGTLWVGGWTNLHAFRDGNWRVYHDSEAPFPSQRQSLLEASDGALWMAGLGQEAARLDYGTAPWTTYGGLFFQCETPDGAQWFVSQDSSVVRHDSRGWTRYGVEEGLMDRPLAILATRQGILWATGSHDRIAATAQFDGMRWSLQTHPRFSQFILPSAVYESLDGSLWFGSQDPVSERGQLGGVLRFDPSTGSTKNEKAWTHFISSRTILENVYGIGQTADGVIYAGGPGGLCRFDPSAGSGQAWTRISEPTEFTTTLIDAIYTALKGDLWVGTRAYGAFHYDGKTWTRYDVRDGLANNSIRAILQTNDKSVWVGTDKGISRFDGQTWTTHALPPDLRIELLWVGSLRQSRDGALWINQVSREGKSIRFRTTRYQPDFISPETEITLSLDKVSQPGNTTLAWKGTDPWKATPDEEVQYSYRMDGGEWSPFSAEKNRVFLALSSGAHTFEVRARDRDFNVDPTPAAIRFVVVPPVWRQPWFIGLMAVLLGAVGLQTARVVRRDRRLQESNMALSAGNKELFALNRALQQKTEDLEKANAQIQKANRQAQEATERKSRFLASMSHELRTPMNAIIGFTRMVLRRAGDLLPERQRENLVKVQQASDHLLSLINDILDLSKVEAGRVEIKPVRFDVRALIASCCSTVNPLVRPGVTLNYEVTDGVGEAHTDKSRLQQILINLLSNALKFTERGEVRVSVRPLPRLAPLGFPSPINGRGVDRAAGRGEGLSSTEGSLEDKTLEIAVSDTGIGIPPEALGYIFEEFRQVAGAHQTQKGTGLGLSITKKLTELLGGTIGVESEVGKGSTFTIRIPLEYKEK